MRLKDEDKLIQEKIRFYSLANGLLAISYIAIFGWVAAQLINLFQESDMAAGSYNITIEQGSTYKRTLTIKNGGLPVDISLDSLRGQVRKRYKSATPEASFTFTFVTDGTDGQVEMKITAEETAAMDSGDLVYDVEWVKASGDVHRMLEGNAEVRPEVTR